MTQPVAPQTPEETTKRESRDLPVNESDNKDVDTTGIVPLSLLLTAVIASFVLVSLFFL